MFDKIVAQVKAGGSAAKKVITSRKFQTRFGAVAIMGTVLSARAALAMTQPVSGDFMFDIYDIAVNDILQGPVGYVGGAGAMVVGAITAMQQKIMPAIICILGGATLLKADAIVGTLGMLF